MVGIAFKGNSFFFFYLLFGITAISLKRKQLNFVSQNITTQTPFPVLIDARESGLVTTATKLPTLHFHRAP